MKKYLAAFKENPLGLKWFVEKKVWSSQSSLVGTAYRWWSWQMSMKDLDIINSALALPKACLSLQDEANGHIWGGETYHVTLKLKALKIQAKWKSCIIPSFGYMNSSNWTKSSKPPKYNVTYDKSKHFKYRMVTSIASAAIYNLTVLLSKEDIQMKTTANLCRYRRENPACIIWVPQRWRGVHTKEAVQDQGDAQRAR